MGSVVSPIRAAEAGRTVAASTVDVSAFREAMGSFPTGVTVVTVACDDGNLHGMTVNSFSSVSLDPMLVLVCLDETSRGLGLIERAGAFAVNVLSAGQQDVVRIPESALREFVAAGMVEPVIVARKGRAARWPTAKAAAAGSALSANCLPVSGRHATETRTG